MTGSIAHRTLTSPRLPALAGIVALHLLVAYLLLTALVQRPAAEAPPPLAVIDVPADHLPPEPAPPLQGGATTRKPRAPIPVPVPDVTSPVPPDVSAPTGTYVPSAPVSNPSPPESIRLIGKNWLPNSQDYYPPDLIRDGVQGNAQLRVCVDEAGHLSGAPVIEQTSGNARLDQGALNVVRAGRYARAVRGDTPVPNCYEFRIVFSLK